MVARWMIVEPLMSLGVPNVDVILAYVKTSNIECEVGGLMRYAAPDELQSGKICCHTGVT